MSGRLIAGNAGRLRIDCESIDFDYDNFRMEFKDASTEIWIPNKVKQEYNIEIALGHVEHGDQIALTFKQGWLIYLTSLAVSFSISMIMNFLKFMATFLNV